MENPSCLTGRVKSAAVVLASGCVSPSATLHAGGKQASAAASSSASVLAGGAETAGPGLPEESGALGGAAAVETLTFGTSTSRDPESRRRLCFSELSTELPSGPLPTPNFISPSPTTCPGITSCGGLLVGGSSRTVAAASSMLLMLLPPPAPRLMGLVPPPRLSPGASVRERPCSLPYKLVPQVGSGASTDATISGSGFMSRPPHCPLSNRREISEDFTTLVRAVWPMIRPLRIAPSRSLQLESPQASSTLA